MEEQKRWSFPWWTFLAEFAGTGLLLLVGLSLVTFMFGTGSPMASLIPSVTLRRIITGFLFGGTGALIALSHLGKKSGAHINPVVTMTFRLYGKIDARTAAVYILGQLSGAVVGCLPLLLWGSIGRNVSFGATSPGQGYTVPVALLGEVITTFVMVSLLIIFLGIRRIRRWDQGPIDACPSP